MAKIPSYPALLKSALGAADQIVIDHNDETRNMTVTEMNKQWVTKDGDSTIDGDLTADNYIGNGAGLTGIASGTGGVVNTGSTTIGADSNSSGVGEIAFQIDSVTKATITNAGVFEIELAEIQGLNDDLVMSGKELLNSKTIADMQVGPYFHFDGVPSKVIIPDNIDIEPGTHDYSLFFWVRTTDASASINILGKWTSGTGIIGNLESGVLKWYEDISGFDNIESNGVINDGFWHGIGIISNRDGLVTMYIDGAVQIDTMSGRLGTLSNAVDFRIGWDGASGYFNGDIDQIRLINRVVSSNEAKSFSSNPQKAIDWADVGGSNVSKVLSSFVNGSAVPYDSLAGGSTSAFVAATTTTGRANHGLEIAFKKGKKYRLSYTASSMSGSAPVASIVTAETGSAATTVEAAHTTTIGINTKEFTSIYTGNTMVQFTSATAAGYTIADLSFVQLGATLVIDPKDASPIQVKSSVNQIEGLVTGATLENASLDHVYQDIYRAIADNGTFNVPVGCAFLEILINTTTLQAAQTIRIGTADGGQQVVADSTAPATAGMKRLAVLIDGFSAGDTLYIGSDGGSGWTTLVADLYVRYQIIKV
jgi:hypothetical protein